MKQILLFTLAFSPLFLFAQQAEQCGQVAYKQYLETLKPGINNHIDQVYFEALKQSKIKTKYTPKDTLHTIKVVFHVVYNTVQENLPDQYIYSQLDILNECFRRQNADTILTRDIFKSVAGDAGIHFELATVDELGNATSGIVRKLTTKTSFLSGGFDLSEADQVKGEILGSKAWDTEKYLNIWICDLSLQGQDVLLGYAFPPTGAPNWNASSFVFSDRQGVVAHYKAVGLNNPISRYKQGKTLVHEVGHYLGLRHIWGDAPNWGRCNTRYDDFIEDTPLSGTSSSATSGCNWNKNTCIWHVNGDLPDQIENYMDYAPEQCQNMFSEGQIRLMRANLTSFRMGIYTTEFPEPLGPVIDNDVTGVFPNPAKDQLVINILDFKEENSYSLQIVNMLGKEVFSQNIVSIKAQYLNYNFGIRGPHIYRIMENTDKVIKEDKILFLD